MAKKKIVIALGIVVALNAVIIVSGSRANANWDAAEREARAAVTQELSRNFRVGHIFALNAPFHLIGDLAFSPWTDVLPLTASQTESLTRLDKLLKKADHHSVLVHADYLDKNPPDYKEYLKRNETRRVGALQAAQRVVALGVLTKAQADFVMQRYLNEIDPQHTLGNAVVQPELGMTKEQKVRLANVWKAGNARAGRLSLMSQDPDVKKINSAEWVANEKAMNEEALKILTPEQMQIWSRLRAKKTLPPEPPQLPALTDVAAAQQAIQKLSPALRLLAENEGSLALSDEQKSLLKELDNLTCLGWLWIGSDRGRKVDETRAEFVKQAEQVAMLGILTEDQARQLRGFIKTD